MNRAKEIDICARFSPHTRLASAVETSSSNAVAIAAWSLSDGDMAVGRLPGMVGEDWTA